MAQRDRVRRELRENSHQLKVTRLQLVHPYWTDTLKLNEQHRVAVRAGGAQDAAEVLRYTNDSITLKWDKYGTETYERRSDGRYHLRN